MRTIVWRSLLITVVAIHIIVITGNTAALVLLPFWVPWYISFPLCSYIFWILQSSVVDCPLTKLENKLRKRLEMREIRGFVGEYAIRPYRKLKKKYIK